jgi:hypothetical protein
MCAYMHGFVMVCGIPPQRQGGHTAKSSPLKYMARREMCITTLPACVQNARLEGAYFIKAVVPRASFENANLSDVLMDRAVMVDANLRGAVLQRAVFTRSDLTGAGECMCAGSCTSSDTSIQCMPSISVWYICTCSLGL